MKRRTSITLIARALLFSVVVLLAGNGTSYAQQSDIDSVKAAVAAFHAALGTLDVSKMDPLWAHDAYVMVIQPRDKSISVGWDAVKKDLQLGFRTEGHAGRRTLYSRRWQCGVVDGNGERRSQTEGGRCV